MGGMFRVGIKVDMAGEEKHNCNKIIVKVTLDRTQLLSSIRERVLG